MPESTLEKPYTRWRDPYFLATLLIGSLLRGVGYQFPQRQIFDEVYYLSAAEDYLACQPDANSVHPPLAKIQMALIEAFADGLSGGAVLERTYVWRLPSLLFGILILVWTHRFAWAITRHRWITNLTTALVAIDFLAIVQSRVAMLDQIQAFWILAAFTATAEFIFGQSNGSIACGGNGKGDIPLGEGSPGAPSQGAGAGSTPNRAEWTWGGLVNCLGGASLCFGIATACKWNGLFAAFGAFLAVQGLVRTPVTKSLTAVARVCVFLLFLGGGVFVYAASYLPYVGYTPFYTPLAGERPKPKSLKVACDDIIGFHKRMIKFRYNQKEFVHRYLSYFYQWPLMIRPVWYYYEEVTPPSKAENPTKYVQGIVGMGSVVFWWPAFFLLLDAARGTLWAWLRPGRWRRKKVSLPGLGMLPETPTDQSALLDSSGAPVAPPVEPPAEPSADELDTVSQFSACMYFPQWLLWAAGTTGGFIYYMLPMIPAMALIVARYVEETRHDWVTRVYLVALVVALVLYYPLLVGFDIPDRFFHTIFPSQWI